MGRIGIGAFGGLNVAAIEVRGWLWKKYGPGVKSSLYIVPLK